MQRNEDDERIYRPDIYSCQRAPFPVWHKFFVSRPEIPWPDVIGMRNHIAHGYFDINGYLVFSTVKDDLEPMKVAIEFFIEKL